MSDRDRAGGFVESCARLERLQPDCARRLLRQRELQEALRKAGSDAEETLDTVNSDYRQRRGSVSDGLLQRGIEDPNLYQGTQKTRSEGHRRGRSEVR